MNPTTETRFRKAFRDLINAAQQIGTKPTAKRLATLARLAEESRGVIDAKRGRPKNSQAKGTQS